MIYELLPQGNFLRYSFYVYIAMCHPHIWCYVHCVRNKIAMVVNVSTQNTIAMNKKDKEDELSVHLCVFHLQCVFAWT